MSYIPPYFERGKIPFADRLNQMIDVLRSCIIAPGVGYTLTRTAQGQVLNIQRGSSGGGAAAVAAPCPFAVSDASEGTTLKVSIASGLIDGRWPKGMGPDLPDPKIDLRETGYVYCVIEFDSNYQVLTSEDGYKFLFFSDLQENTNTLQYSIAAVVVVTDGKISSITNQCTQFAANACALNVPV